MRKFRKGNIVKVKNTLIVGVIQNYKANGIEVQHFTPKVAVIYHEDSLEKASKGETKLYKQLIVEDNI